jgi:hypothetical protein
MVKVDFIYCDPAWDAGYANFINWIARREEEKEKELEEERYRELEEERCKESEERYKLEDHQSSACEWITKHDEVQS